MNLKVIRNPNTIGTPGQLSIDGAFECYTLELYSPVGGQSHIKGACCVPLGKYSVNPRFEGEVYEWMSKSVPAVAKGGIPHIMNIGGVEYPMWIDYRGILPDQFVLIHIGNKLSDTQGCLLTGTVQNKDNTMSESTAAFSRLYSKIVNAMTAGTLTIEYVNA